MREEPNNIVIKNSVWEWAFAVFFCLLLFQVTWTYNVLLFAGQRYSQYTANESLAISAAFIIVLCTAIGPAHRLTGSKSNDIRLRRPLALCATALLAGHVFLTIITEKELMSPQVFYSCIALGVFNALIVVSLAMTSFAWAVQKLGHERWKKLHSSAAWLPLTIMPHYLILGRHKDWLEWFGTFGQPYHELAPASTFLLTAFCMLVLMLRLTDSLVRLRKTAE